MSMITRLILDPAALNPGLLADQEYRKEAELCLRGITENGILLVDSHRSLLAQLALIAETLSSKNGQHISLLITEILKDRRRFVCCDDFCAGSSINHNDELMYSLSVGTKNDGIVLGMETLKSLRDRGISFNNLIDLRNYSASSVEVRRRSFLTSIPTFDEMSEDQVDDLFVRTIQYTKTLRFFDKMIGQANRIENYCRGIIRILDLWKEHGHAFKPDSRLVEIYTLQKKQYASIENQAAIVDLEKRLVNPLREKYPWDIRLRVKASNPTKFHARHLQGEQVTIQIDRGFDLFDARGKYLTNTITLANGHNLYLNKYMNLPE